MKSASWCGRGANGELLRDLRESLAEFGELSRIKPERQPDRLRTAFAQWEGADRIKSWSSNARLPPRGGPQQRTR